MTWSEHSSSTSGVNQSKSLTVNGWATTKVQLTGLRKFTKYDISIRAFNSIASGPASAPIVGTTQEGGIVRMRNCVRTKKKQQYIYISISIRIRSTGNTTDSSNMRPIVFSKRQSILECASTSSAWRNYSRIQSLL